jgi:hypothetical protein
VQCRGGQILVSVCVCVCACVALEVTPRCRVLFGLPYKIIHLSLIWPFRVRCSPTLGAVANDGNGTAENNTPSNDNAALPYSSEQRLAHLVESLKSHVRTNITFY